MLQDVLLPYVQDTRLPEDCLFVVAEGDHRFYKRDLFSEQHDFTWKHIGVREYAQIIEEALKASVASDSGDRPATRSPEAKSESEQDGASGTSAKPAMESWHEAWNQVSSDNRTAMEDMATSRKRPAPKRMPSSGRRQPPPPPPSSSETSAAAGSRDPNPARAISNTYPRLRTGASMESPTCCETATTSATPPPRLSEKAIGGWDPVHPRCFPSEEIKDIVKVMTFAKRLGYGNFCWLQWEHGGKGLKEQPGHGLGLVAFTKKFAADFLEHLRDPSTTPRHLDLILRDWLLKPGRQEQGGYCFMYPTAGSFETHRSGCDPKLAEGQGRKSTFYVSDATNIAEGFRGSHRYLGRVVESGKVPWLNAKAINFDDDLAWKTEMPPTTFEDERWSRRLWERWWWSPKSGWKGPELTPQQEKAYDNKNRVAKQKRAPPEYVNQVAQAPMPGAESSGHRKRDHLAEAGGPAALKFAPLQKRQLPDGTWNSISRLAEALATTPISEDDWADAKVQAATEDRERKVHVRKYLMRNFVTSEVSFQFFSSFMETKNNR